MLSTVINNENKESVVNSSKVDSLTPQKSNKKLITNTDDYLSFFSLKLIKNKAPNVLRINKSQKSKESSNNNIQSSKSKLSGFELNSNESSLPKYCVTTNNTDLGVIMAKIFFKSKLYIQALKSLTPTIIGVEMLVGERKKG